MGYQMSESQLANLRPVNTLPRDEFLRRSAEGGRKSAETKRKRKECAEVLKILLDKVYKDKKGAKADGREVLMVSLFNKAVKEADVPAMKLVLSLIGEMPNQTQELSIKSNKDENENGMLEELLKANLEIQKQVMREQKDGEQTGAEHPD